jgi:DNA polymerase-3 subunit epsilon/CBS domain-containing protein
MIAVTYATPLISLDAVVIDTETTGLDPRTARIVEIGAVRLAHGSIEAGSGFRQLVDPKEPIPAEASRIHGIGATKLQGAPDFPQAWPQFRSFAGDAVQIGHTVGYDLAVMKSECARAGLSWQSPRTLDTQLLSQIARPDLAGYSLEEIASWLGVEISERHSALGDATTTARIFHALVPKLRDRGIRTFAEAQQACLALTEVIDRQYRAGWVPPDAAIGDASEETKAGRFDSYPYRHRVYDVMSTPPKTMSSDKTLGDALAQLIRDRISSLFITFDVDVSQTARASQAGIVTERDILRAIEGHGNGALELSVAQFVSRPLATIPADAFVYRAIGRMSRLKIRHLGVTDEKGDLVGALSARDLLRLRAAEAISLGDEIDQAGSVPALGRAWARLPGVAASLLSEDIPAREIAAVVSRELGALSRQAAILAEGRMRDTGLGDPPCKYAFAVLGSGGRGESLLAMDQDNAIIFERGEPGGPEDMWFAKLGEHAADFLNEVGVPYCKGGVMAKNPPWRGSIDTWRQRIAHWVTRSSPADLLAVDIVFDLRGVHGDTALSEAIWRDAFDAAKGRADFAKLLAEAAGDSTSGLNFFGGIKTEQGRIDLKKAGLFGIVTTARALAVCHHVLERTTPRRISGVMSLGIGGERDLESLLDAHATFLKLILSQQLADIKAGKPPSYRIAVKHLSRSDRARLQAALQSVRSLNELTRSLLFKER